MAQGLLLQLPGQPRAGRSWCVSRILLGSDRRVLPDDVLAGEAAVIHPIEAPVADQWRSAGLETVGKVTSVDEVTGDLLQELRGKLGQGAGVGSVGKTVAFEGHGDTGGCKLRPRISGCFL